jgi:hypothetical protein
LNHGATVMKLVPYPTATTGSATGVAATAASLNGSAADNGLATTVTFDYGPTTGYGSSIAASTGGNLAVGDGLTSVSATLSGLTLGLTYHFRVVATNSTGAAYGDDATFTTVQKKTAISALPRAAQIAYGQPLASSALSGGAATYNGGSVAGSFAWSAPATMPTLGVSSQPVTFTPANSTDYAVVTGTVSVTAKGSPLLTTGTQSKSLQYGAGGSVAVTATGLTGKPGPSGLVSYILTNSSGVYAGSGQVALATGTGASIANIPISSTLVPDYYQLSLSYYGDANYNAANPILSGVVVTAASQTVVFAQPKSPVAFGAAAIALKATASSKLAVSFTASSACAVSGSTLSFTKVGACTVTAIQQGNTNYSAATPVSRTIVVTKATPVLTWAAPAAIAYRVKLSAAQLNAKSSVAGTFAYSPVAGAVLPAGKQTLTAIFTPTDTTNYAKGAKTVVLTVNKAAQTIAFAAIATQKVGTLTLKATATSDLAVSFASTTKTVCTVTGSKASLLKAGTCTLQATQPGNANFNTAPVVSRSFTVK